MDWHKYQKLLYWKDFVMNCFCFQIICDHLIVMRYFVMGDHVMAINVPVAIHIVCALRSPLLGVEIAIDQVIVKSVLSSHTSPSPAPSAELTR